MKFNEIFKPTKLKIILAVILFLFFALIAYSYDLKNYLILILIAFLIYPITCLLVEFQLWWWYEHGFITKRIR